MILIFFDSVSVITFFQIKNELLSSNLFFFSTLTVYIYFKVFSIDNRDFFLQFPRHLQHLYHIRFILNCRFSDL